MSPRVVVISGGLGGARLATAFRALGRLDTTTFVVNVADDTWHLGLKICPDHDSVLYAAAGVLDLERGWGRRDETFAVMDAMAEQGAPQWFSLGDRDLAVHLRRTEMLRAGATLTDVAADLCAGFGLPSCVLPASDQPIATRVGLETGEVAFQTYHVEMGGRPDVADVRYQGLDEAVPTAAVLAALDAADHVLIAASSPVASVLPILGLPGVRRALSRRRDTVSMLSPMVSGRPLVADRDLHRARTRTHLLGALGVAHDPPSAGRLLADVAGTFVLDPADAVLAPEWDELDQEVVVGPTVLDDRASAPAELAGLLEVLGG